MKLGLTLEGGAHRTYFSIGIMDFFLEQNIIADYVIGASAGIANATSYISKQKGRNLEVAEKYIHDKRYMGFLHLLRPSNRSFYNLDFVFKEIPSKYVLFDCEAFEKSGCETIAVVTDIKTGKPQYLKVSSENGQWKEVIASCSLPLMFPAVEINGNLYMDGGITNPIPVKKAMQSGCDKNIVIITRERDYIKTKEPGAKLAACAYRKYPEFSQAILNRIDVYNKYHHELLELEKAGEVFLFMPENTDGWGRTESDPKKLRMMYDKGYEMAKNRLPELLKYLNS